MGRERGVWEALGALADPRGEPALRRRGLRLYAASLLLLQGLVLGALALFLPQAQHPLLLLLALVGGGWLWALGRGALREEGPLAPAVAVGLGAALFLFLGAMGLLLRPGGLFLLLAGALGFFGLLRRAEGTLTLEGGGPGGGP
ncbi:hypothetical protein [Thermus igniterrae]|jgi:hypothetical protein|uniref:hypothetical protein n=1 Tax=Thermus igniterrae TaxID=88189 RepID=UPI0003603A0E|nr:hypothetical protein [Thermus igniterrae]